jgi:beta-lactamase superfamily II metal-dependent hydrolase
VSTTPEHVSVRMYQVGFGDCFLVSFDYDQPLDDGRNKRHVLVDMGSTHKPRDGPGKVVAGAAKLIAEHADAIDVVVATHRHRDHLSGFADAGAAETVATFKPKLVMRPWTDDPALPEDATKPRDDPRNFAAMLAQGQAYAKAVAERIGEADARSLRGELAAATDEQLPNLDAINQLNEWAENGRGEYLSAGMESRLGEIVPGINVRVLGPPRIDQWPEMLDQTASDPEYWMAQLTHIQATPDRVFDDRRPAEMLVRGAEGEELLVEPGPVSWLIDKLERQQLHSLMRIVRTVDDALNNTSLILLIDSGDVRMLFPGDAQIENWSWSLKHAPNSAEIRKLLARVDLYKVGHHGSRNGTPRTLFRLWGEDPDPKRPMVALMSTMAGPHGETEATKVPRQTLVDALERRATLLTTNELDKELRYLEVKAKTSGGGRFTQVS